MGVRFAAQPDPSESSEGHLLDLGAVVIEATPSQLGRLAIIQNSFNFPPGESLVTLPFLGSLHRRFFCLLGGFGGGGSLSYSLVIPSHVSLTMLLGLVGA